MTLFAGIDVGTSGGRCLLVDEHGRRAGFGARRWAVRTREVGIRAMDPAATLAAIEGAFGDALAGRDPREIAAVGVAGARLGLALVDEAGETLDLVPVDGRAAAEGLADERAHGEGIYAATGRLPALLFVAPRLRWFRDHRPEILARARWALSFSDWLVHALTGVAATEPTQAAEMLCFDLASGAWSDDLVAALEVPARLLPPILAPGAPAGACRGALGIAEGTPVVPAGGDSQAATLGVGAVSPGEAAVVAGVTMFAARVRADPSVDQRGRLWTSPHVVPGRFVQEAHHADAGAAVEWLAGILGVDADAVAAAADGAPPGARGVALTGPWPSEARDFVLVRPASLAFRAPVIALGPVREDLARAAFEAVAFAARVSIGRLEEAGGPISSLAAAGGVARSDAFLAALAGAAERPVRAATEPASSALGAAIAAAAGHHGGVEAAARAMADRGREVAPDPSHGYPAHYAAWLERAEAMESTALRVTMLP